MGLSEINKDNLTNLLESLSRENKIITALASLMHINLNRSMTTMPQMSLM